MESTSPHAFRVEVQKLIMEGLKNLQEAHMKLTKKYPMVETVPAVQKLGQLKQEINAIMTEIGKMKGIV